MLGRSIKILRVFGAQLIQTVSLSLSLDSDVLFLIVFQELKQSFEEALPV